ncbi:MAG: acetyl-CoA synthetase [Dehalococcoidia bacterium]|nr:acetyl-CoA synthetase [Dehalococcoidia bacterium]
MQMGTMTSTEIFKKAHPGDRTLLTEVESKALVQEAGIPVVPTHLARNKSQAARIAQALGLPVVMKVVSPEVVHKSDVGGVKTGLRSLRQVRAAYDDLVASTRKALPSASILGVAVQRMAPPGVEVILGAFRNPEFGHVVMFGLGGVMVEVLQDVSLRLVPLTRRDARQMVREIKGFSLLNGYRQHPPCDILALEEALLNLSLFLEKHPEVKELDLNPVFCYPQGILAVDARVVLEEVNPNT